MIILGHFRAAQLLVSLFLVIFITNSINADSIGNPPNNRSKQNYNSIFRSTVQSLNSVNGLILMGSGSFGNKNILFYIAPCVLDPIVTEASKRIDAEEHPKAGLAIGVANLVNAGIYGYMLETITPGSALSLTAILWSIKGTKCLLTSACQFVLAAKT